MEKRLNPAVDFIKKHPQIALTIGYLVLVTMGIVYDLMLSRIIGINILEFSNISDLALAPFRKITILKNWLIFMGLLIFLFYLNRFMERYEKLFKWMHFGYDIKSKPWYNTYTWIAIVFSFSIYTFYASTKSALNDYKDLQQGKGNQYTFYTTDKDSKLTSGFLLAKTEQAFFVYDTITKQTKVLINNQVLRLDPTHINLTVEQQIRAIMAKQEAAWNKAAVPEFMEGYWKSDSLCFIGSKGLTYGWKQTLDNYKKSYPDKESLGTLKFRIKKVEQTSNTSAFVIGAWHLKRPKKGDLSGHYTLFWKKIGGEWVIVADHSS